MKKAKIIHIVIENISQGKEKGYMATIPELHHSVAFGENYDELSKGIGIILEEEKIDYDESILKTITGKKKAKLSNRKISSKVLQRTK